MKPSIRSMAGGQVKVHPKNLPDIEPLYFLDGRCLSDACTVHLHLLYMPPANP